MRIMNMYSSVCLCIMQWWARTAVWQRGSIVDIHFLPQHDQSWKKDWRKSMRAAITADGDVRENKKMSEIETDDGLLGMMKVSECLTWNGKSGDGTWKRRREKRHVRVQKNLATNLLAMSLNIVSCTGSILAIKWMICNTIYKHATLISITTHSTHKYWVKLSVKKK